jgi:hypothetical protein
VHSGGSGNSGLVEIHTWVRTYRDGIIGRPLSQVELAVYTVEQV